MVDSGLWVIIQNRKKTHNLIIAMNIQFVSKLKYFYAISIVLVGASILSLIVFGLKPNIDFTGGSLIELTFTSDRPEIHDVADVLSPETYGEVLIQPVGDTGLLLKTRYLTEAEHQTILKTLREKFETPASESVSENRVLEKSVETVGPAISSTLKTRSAQAIIAVVLAIGAYIAYSFRKVSRPVASWKYGMAAIVALIHDIFITLGAFSLLGHFFGIEVGISFVVALLTILGYSINDTIVVFDRVRENLTRYGSSDFESVVNRAFNETFVRSLNTSITVLMVLTSMFVFGGESIRYFVLALIIGIFFGTYSSIFIASSLLVSSHRLSKRKRRA